MGFDRGRTNTMQLKWTSSRRLPSTSQMTITSSLARNLACQWITCLRGHVVTDGDERRPRRPVVNEFEKRLLILDIHAIHHVHVEPRDGSHTGQHGSAWQAIQVPGIFRPVRKGRSCTKFPVRYSVIGRRWHSSMSDAWIIVSGGEVSLREARMVVKCAALASEKQCLLQNPTVPHLTTLQAYT